MESPIDSIYVSAPSSPSRVSFNSHPVHFYSAPTSPTHGLNTVPLVWELEQEELRTSSRVSFELIDDFEFETTKKFESSLHQHQQPQQPKTQHREDLPPMSFADELFCNGQVLPLKLPPRLQYVNNGKSSNRSLTASFQTSQSLVLKGPFFSWSFKKNDVKNNDIDPFMAALEHVRKDERGGDLGSPHRRTRSLSPVRVTSQWSNSNGSIGGAEHKNKEVGPQQPIQIVGSTPSVPTKPKISASARPVRRTVSSHKRPIKPTLTTLPGPTVKTSAKKSDGSRHKGCKRLNIKEFLFRSASEGRADCKDKLRPHTAALRKLQKNLSFKSIYETQYIAKKEVPGELMKKPLIHYRPSGLLLCLGFGPRCLRTMK